MDTSGARWAVMEGKISVCSGVCSLASFRFYQLNGRIKDRSASSHSPNNTPPWRLRRLSLPFVEGQYGLGRGVENRTRSGNIDWKEASA